MTTTSNITLTVPHLVQSLASQHLAKDDVLKYVKTALYETCPRCSTERLLTLQAPSYWATSSPNRNTRSSLSSSSSIAWFRASRTIIWKNKDRVYSHVFFMSSHPVSEVCTLMFYSWVQYIFLYTNVIKTVWEDYRSTLNQKCNECHKCSFLCQSFYNYFLTCMFYYSCNTCLFFIFLYILYTYTFIYVFSINK